MLNIFRRCNGLTAVTSLNPTPPFIYSNTFSSYSATLRVPTGCKDAYAAAINWSNFRNIEEIESSMPGDANADQAVDVADVAAIVNKILGEPGADFNETDADVNGDGKIDVDDVVAVVNIILDSGQQNAREMMLILEECGFHF